MSDARDEVARRVAERLKLKVPVELVNPYLLWDALISSEQRVRELEEGLRRIADGPLSQNCSLCMKTTRFNGNLRITNHDEDCPVFMAEAALSPKVKPDLLRVRDVGK